MFQSERIPVCTALLYLKRRGPSQVNNGLRHKRQRNVIKTFPWLLSAFKIKFLTCLQDPPPFSLLVISPVASTRPTTLNELPSSFLFQGLCKCYLFSGDFLSQYLHLTNSCLTSAPSHLLNNGLQALGTRSVSILCWSVKGVQSTTAGFPCLSAAANMEKRRMETLIKAWCVA